MSTLYWRGGRSSCWLLCAALVLGPMAVAACGSVSASGATAGSGAPVSASGATAGPGAPAAGARAGETAGPADLVLCANPAAADRVVITRSRTTYEIQPEHFQPPGQRVVTAVAHVRALATALCALPRMLKGVVNCPALFDGGYKLTFSVVGRSLPVVTIQESGCQTVTGLGPARSASTSPGFWAVLAKAGSISSPIRPVFLPGSPPRSHCGPVLASVLGTTHCPGRAMPGGSARI